MNYTQNYQLCLWDEDDRILMEDFNGDNTKIDAALKANADAITDLEATVGDQAAELDALGGRAGAQLLASGSAPVGENAFTISMAGVTWSQWKTVYIVVELTAQEGMGSYSLYVNDDDELTRCVVEQWIGNGDDNFYKEITPVLRQCVAGMKETWEKSSL